MKTLIIDNYDSYTFNLYQLIAEVNGEYPTVIYNDQVIWDELKQLESSLFISFDCSHNFSNMLKFPNKPF